MTLSPLTRHGFVERAGRDDLERSARLRHQARRLAAPRDPRSCPRSLRARARAASAVSRLRACDTKPIFGRRALQRHLAAFEADLVVAARAGALALVAAAAGLAEARAARRGRAACASNLRARRAGVDRSSACSSLLDLQHVADLRRSCRGSPGVSATSTVWWRCAQPEAARALAALACGRSGSSAASTESSCARLLALSRRDPQPEDLFDGLAALRRDLRRRAHLASAFIVARTTLIGLREP